MNIKISENEFTYCQDITKQTGEIIVTFSSGIKTMWYVSMCVMDQAEFNNNILYIQEQYNIFLNAAKTKARENGLIVF